MRTPDLAVRERSAAAFPKISGKESPGGFRWDGYGADGRVADCTRNAWGTRGEG